MRYILDCTPRDGGYYNDWDFEPELVHDYLQAMDALQIDFVEIGFRSLKNDVFKGGCAYSTDTFLNSLAIPSGLADKIGVMINGSEISNPETQIANLEKLFYPKAESPVSLVRIACHVHEFIECLPAATWLKQQGYLVGFNLMQVADRTPAEITQLAIAASNYPLDALYFADSMGSLNPQQVTDIIHAFQQGWQGALGIHTHDNMGQAIANSLQAVKSGVTWINSTVTGMGRGPGNAQTEYLILALAEFRQSQGNPTKLFELIRKHFKPMQNRYGWGTNPFSVYAYPDGSPLELDQKKGVSQRIDHSVLQLNHYQIKSQREFERKIQKDSANKAVNAPDRIRQKTEVLFQKFDQKETEYFELDTQFLMREPTRTVLNIKRTPKASPLKRLLAACYPFVKRQKPFIFVPESWVVLVRHSGFFDDATSNHLPGCKSCCC